MTEFQTILNGHGLAKYGCAHCEFTCGNKYNLENHLRDEHGAEV